MSNIANDLKMIAIYLSRDDWSSEGVANHHSSNQRNQMKILHKQTGRVFTITADGKAFVALEDSEPVLSASGVYKMALSLSKEVKSNG